MADNRIKSKSTDNVFKSQKASGNKTNEKNNSNHKITDGNNKFSNNKSIKNRLFICLVVKYFL